MNSENILNYFPNKIHMELKKYINENNIIMMLEEIRIRVNKPIILKFNQEEKVINYIISPEEILDILQKICENSIYSYQSQICNRIYNSKRWTQGRNNWK